MEVHTLSYFSESQFKYKNISKIQSSRFFKISQGRLYTRKNRT